MEFTEKSLVEYIGTQLLERQCKDIHIMNVTLLHNSKIAYATVSYIWNLNATEHRAFHKDSLFIFVEEEKNWHSADFMW